MAISATASKNVYATASPDQYPWKFTVSFEETEVSGSADNTSTITVTGTMYGKNIYYTNHDNRNLYVYWYDDNEHKEGTLVAKKEDISSTTKGKAITIEGSITVAHKEDGTLNGYAQLKWDGSSGSSSWAAKDTTLNTGETALTSIPRYLSITKFEQSYKDETTIKLNWATSNTCSKLVVYNNNTAKSTIYPNATSGTVSVSTSAGSSNTIYIVCTSAASSLNTASDSITISTYYFPHVTSVGTANWVIGNNQTLNIYNPLGRTFQVYMTDKNGTVVWKNESATGTSVTITGSSVNSTQLYASIPNATSGTAYYYCKYNYANQTASKTSNYLCNPTACKPVVNATNFQYKDISDTAQNIIKDNQILVQGHSKLAVHFEATTAKNSATIKKYKITFGGETIEYTTHCASGVFVTPFNRTISQNGNTNVYLSVVDSRGYTSNSVALPVTIRAWSKPTVAVTASRKNDFEESTTLNVTVTNYSLLKNSSGQEINEANKSISYVCKNNSTGATVDSGDITSTLTKTLDLNQEQSFTFLVTISDSFGATYATTSTVIVNRGTPIMMVDGEKLGVGINCFPEGDGLYVDGPVQFYQGIESLHINNLTSDDVNINNSLKVNGNKIESIEALYRYGCQTPSDEDFRYGLNGISVYDNNSSGKVTFSRIDDATAPNMSQKIVKITVNGSSSSHPTPGCGGFFWSNASRAGWVWTYIFTAKIPVGYSVVWASNPFGDNSHVEWITSTKGTGQWETYICRAFAGTTGSFQTIGFFYLTPDSGTTNYQLTWYLARATYFVNSAPSTPYPVGSIYMSIESTSPASLFGGNWTPLKDKFLIGAGNIYGKEATGGYTTITLTAAQSGLRDHTHPASYSGANFYIRHGKTSGTATVKAGTNTTVETGVGSDVWGNGFDTAEYSHNLDRVNIGGTVSVSGSGTLNAAEAHSNMPPYLAVYMWKRVS